MFPMRKATKPRNLNEEPADSLEKPEYKVVYRKSNLETLSIGRNRIEIEELMGEPEGKSSGRRKWIPLGLSTSGF